MITNAENHNILQNYGEIIVNDKSYFMTTIHETDNIIIRYLHGDIDSTLKTPQLASTLLPVAR